LLWWQDFCIFKGGIAMESILNLIVNAENVRMLVTLVFGFSCFVWLKTSLEKKIDGVDKRIDGVEASIKSELVAIHRRIDGVESSLSRRIDDLKHNDFAHLTSTIEALTYALEKNGSLKKEDKEYVDSRLAH
jgi:hypothetical protein